MATNDTLALTVVGDASGQQHIHTLHFRIIDPTETEASLVTHWRTNCMTTFRGCFTSGDTPAILIRAQKVCGSLPLPAAYEEAVIAPAGVGTRTFSAERLPSFVASLVSLKGTLAGRTHLGRFFLGGINESDCALNTFVAGYLAAVQAYVDALKAQYVTGTPADFQLVIHSRKTASVPGTDCTVSSDRVASAVVRTNPTTMRSRKLGHGV